MNKEEKIQLINLMADMVIEGSKRMPDYVFEFYYQHKILPKYKQLYNLLADSFLTLYSICLLMRANAWSQASTILRMAIEEVSKVVVLIYEKGSLDHFANLMIEQSQYINMSNEEQKVFMKNHNFKRKIEVDNYFDYFWIKDYTNDNSYGRNQMVKLARLDEFLVDIEELLNKFAHGSINIFQFSYNNWEHMKKYGYRIYGICFKLFDFLSCAYKKLVGDEIISSPLHNYYPTFKNAYLTWLKKEGWIE